MPRGIKFAYKRLQTKSKMKSPVLSWQLTHFFITLTCFSTSHIHTKSAGVVIHYFVVCLPVNNRCKINSDSRQLAHIFFLLRLLEEMKVGPNMT